MNTTEVVIGFSFGNRDKEPGLSNEAIALAIAKKSSNRTLICVQWEIGTALRRMGVFPDIEVLPKLGEYLDTIAVATEIAAKLKKLHLEHIPRKVGASQLHMPRCLRVLKKLGLPAQPMIADIPCDPLSAQRWTRSPILWRIRALLAAPLIWWRERAIRPVLTLVV